MAQGGINITQEHPIRGPPVQRLQLRLAAVVILRFVRTDDGQQLLLVRKRGVLHPFLQSGPVLRLEIHRETGLLKVVKALHVFDQRLGAVLGQISVMLIGTFRRCETLDIYLRDGSVRIILHRRDGLEDLAQLRGIVAILGIYLRAVYREVEEGASFLHTLFHTFRLRRDVGQKRPQYHRLRDSDREKRRLVITQRLPAATAKIDYQRHLRTLHPLGERNGGMVIERLLLPIVTA